MLEYHERRPIYISKYGNNSKKESVHLKIVATKHESHSERIYELGSELTSATHKANDRMENGGGERGRSHCMCELDFEHLLL